MRVTGDWRRRRRRRRRRRKRRRVGEFRELWKVRSEWRRRREGGFKQNWRGVMEMSRGGKVIGLNRSGSLQESGGREVVVLDR